MDYRIDLADVAKDLTASVVLDLEPFIFLAIAERLEALVEIGEAQVKATERVATAIVGS